MNYQKLISYRGNLLGSNPDLENSPSAIQQAIKKGFDCEIDLWVKDKKIFLGHDYPQYEIDIDFLLDINQFIWIHCKNLSAINYLTEKSDIFNFFWHENDKFTLTSKGFIWTYPNNEYDKNSVIVNLSAELVLEKDCYGICSDYVSQY